MAKLTELIERFDPKNIKPAIERALSKTRTEYLNLLREQLLAGKGSDGEDLKPGYLQDPYFKTPQAAMNYAKWKQKITPSIKRNFNAPNLFVTGFYHNQFKAFVYPFGLQINNLAVFGEDVNRKYNGKATVLGGEWRLEYIQNIFRPVFFNELNLKGIVNSL